MKVTEWHQNAQSEIFIQANITVGKKLKTCRERPHLLSGRFIKLFYKTATYPRQPLLSGLKRGRLMQVSLKKGKQVKKCLTHQDQSSQKSFNKQFCFIRCRRQHLRTVEQRRYSRFIFVENTIGNSPNIPRAKFLRSDGLFYFLIIMQAWQLQEPFCYNYQPVGTLLQNFTLELLLYSIVKNRKSDFY